MISEHYLRHIPNARGTACSAAHCMREREEVVNYRTANDGPLTAKSNILFCSTFLDPSGAREGVVVSRDKEGRPTEFISRQRLPTRNN